MIRVPTYFYIRIVLFKEHCRYRNKVMMLNRIVGIYSSWGPVPLYYYIIMISLKDIKLKGIFFKKDSFELFFFLKRGTIFSVWNGYC